MPSSSSALEAVVHYKKKLTRHLEDNDPDVMLHCLSKLDRVPMTFDILQETEVGRTVNGLKRKPDLDPEVADLAKTIVKKGGHTHPCVSFKCCPENFAASHLTGWISR